MGSSKKSRHAAQRAVSARPRGEKGLVFESMGFKGPDGRTAFVVHIMNVVGPAGSFVPITSQYIYGEMVAGTPFGLSPTNSIGRQLSGPVIPNTEQRAELLAVVHAVWWAAKRPDCPGPVRLYLRSVYRPAGVDRPAGLDRPSGLEDAFRREPDLAEMYNEALSVIDARGIDFTLVLLEQSSDRGMRVSLQDHADDVFSRPRGDSLFLTYEVDW